MASHALTTTAMKRILLVALTTVIVFTLASAGWYYSKWKKKVHTTVTVRENPKLKNTLKEQANSIRPFAKKNNYNTELCFLVNMHIPSGSNRFFIYDLKKDSVADAALVTHGICDNPSVKGVKYDNKIGCGCTSLGKYKIGKPYQGKFGLAYKLYGLDSTNNNAFKRFVVLHAHDCVPNDEIGPFTICHSLGCPTVSPAFLKKLAAIIDASPKPILLCISDDQ
jgi:hypothetical protein